MKSKLIVLGVMVAAMSAAPSVLADVYKCKDSSGKLNYTDSPCPKATQMVPYSKKTKINHEIKLRREAQERRFRDQNYRQTTILVPSY